MSHAAPKTPRIIFDGYPGTPKQEKWKLPTELNRPFLPSMQSRKKSREEKACHCTPFSFYNMLIRKAPLEPWRKERASKTLIYGRSIVHPSRACTSGDIALADGFSPYKKHNMLSKALKLRYIPKLECWEGKQVLHQKARLSVEWAADLKRDHCTLNDGSDSPLVDEQGDWVDNDNTSAHDSK